jgi:hypothetical protein
MRYFHHVTINFKADVNALNARLPRHFADVVAVNDARRWGFRGDFQGGTKGRRNAMRPTPSLLERI